MPDGGQLTIEVANTYLDRQYCQTNPDVSPGQYVMLSVSDTGEGMPKDVLDRAFEPFFTTKELGHGTGLGLSQVYGFVKQSGGHVKIYSEVGNGTTVRMYFPRLDSKIGQDQADESAPPVPGDTEARILVVEDNADLRSYLAEAVRLLGYSVTTAESGSAALDLLTQDDLGIDLMLTDVVMPGMTGRELGERAGALRPDLKVIYITGYSRSALARNGRLDPRLNVLQKPVTQNELAVRIRDALETPRQGRRHQTEA
jgi:CheY-like chemotaxis protein